jgi:glycosyl transferase family 25
MVETKFCFVIASYNNSLNIEKNLQSIINQTYKAWRVIYINDSSTDNTEELFFNIIKTHSVESKFTYIKNDEKRFQMYSKYNAYKLVDDFEIVCLLDGDDWLNKNDVLDILVNVYSSPDVSVVTSNYNIYRKGKIIDNKYTTNYHKHVILSKEYRNTKKWCLRHLKTGYGILFKSIPPEYLKFNDKWLEFSTDMAEMFSVLELSKGRFVVLNDILYTYNYDNSVSYENSWYNLNKLGKQQIDFRKTVNDYLFNMPKCSYYLPYTYIINMPKDTLKKEELIEQLRFQKNTTFKFINAIEGKKDNDNFKLMQNYYTYMDINKDSDKISFDKSIMLNKYKGKYNFLRQHITRKSLGLIQSIFVVLNDFITNDNLTHITIFEDDIFTLKTFDKYLYINYELLQNKDLVYLGCHTLGNNVYLHPKQLSNIFINISNNRDLIYGGYSIIISKKLATYIIELGIDAILKLNLSWDLVLNYIRETNKSFSFFLYYKQLFVPNVVKYGGVNEFRGMSFYTKNKINLIHYYLTRDREFTSIDAINEFLLENRTTPYFNFIKKVVYINSAERTDRKKYTQELLNKYFQRSKIHRFEAIKNKIRSIGSGLSHIGVLEMAIKEDWENVLIVEDDIEFIDDIDSSHTILETISKDKFDVIILGGSSAVSEFSSYKLIQCYSSVAYLVNRHYYRTLLDNFKESNANLLRTMAEHLYTIHIGWNSLQLRDNWLIVKPDMCYQKASYSRVDLKPGNHKDVFVKRYSEVCTINVLITSSGSNILQNMINSLSGQLKEYDCLTIVYDGLAEIPTHFNFTNFKCKIQQFYEPIALGYWGHGIRNKYANLLEKRNFIMHGQDTDMYIDGIFNKIRGKCVDKNSLYIFKIQHNLNILPKELFIREGNVGTPCGVIPYELNNKGTWLNRLGGDGAFYEEIAKHATNIIYSDIAIYNLRPRIMNNNPVTTIQKK